MCNIIMSSKILNQSVSLDDLSASELNAAIDDTNFPGTAKCPNSNAAPTKTVNGKPTSTEPEAVVTSTEKRSAAATTSDSGAVANSAAAVGGCQSLTKANGSADSSAAAGPPAAKRRPNLALKFGPPLVDSDGLETPGAAPWTPRTSTTPGTIFIHNIYIASAI